MGPSRMEEIVKAIEFMAFKGAALKYSIQHVAKATWEKEFADPIRKWVMSFTGRAVEVQGLGKIYIRQNKAYEGLDSARIKDDFHGLVKAGKIKPHEFARLYEVGAITVNADMAAELCASRLKKPVEGYTITIPPSSSTPELRWPAKSTLEKIYQRLKSVADLEADIIRAGKAPSTNALVKTLTQTAQK